MKEKSFVSGLLMCLLAVITWGIMFPVMGSAMKSIDPFYFTTTRFSIALLVLSIWLMIAEGKSKFNTEGKGLKLWFLGTMGMTGVGFLVFLGQKMAGNSGAVIAAIIMAVQPLLGALVNWVVKKTPPKPLTLFFMLMSLTGVVMVISKGDLSIFFSAETNLWAYLFILLGALCFVIYTLGGTYFPSWSPLRYTTITTITGSFTNILIVSFATLMGWLNLPSFSTFTDITWELLYMALVAGVIGFYVWNTGNKIVKPINGILFMNLVPVTAFVVSVLQGYQISNFEITGALITIAGLVGNNLYVRKMTKGLLLDVNR